MNKKTTIVIAIIALLAVSSFSLVGANASVASSSNMGANVSNPVAQRSYIRINGIISQWGTTAVNGVLQTQAGTSMRADSTTNQLAAATAIWTTNTSRPITAVQSKQNFTYTFYEARLTNTSVSTLSASAVAPTNYFLNGTWTIYTVVSNVMITTNANGQITGIHRNQDISSHKAYGALSVTDSWTKFTLAIDGLAPLTGSVFRSVTRQVQFNPFKVTDDISSNVVTKADVAAIIQSYGAIPGWGNFNTRMDFNSNFRVDITDISTVAANM